MEQPVEAEENKVENISFGDEIHPFKNIPEGSLPHQLSSHPFLIPGIAVITFSVSRLSPEDNVDTLKFDFKDPRTITVDVDLSGNYSKEKGFSPLTNAQKLSWLQRLGIISLSSQRNLFGIPQLDEMKDQLNIKGWNPKRLRELALFKSIHNEEPSALIVEADQVPSLAFKVKDLRGEQVRLKAA